MECLLLCENVESTGNYFSHHVSSDQFKTFGQPQILYYHSKCTPGWSGSGLEADAELVSSIVLLQTVVDQSAGRKNPTPLHVLGTLRRPETVQVANHVLSQLSAGHMTAELLQPDELAAGVLTQVSADPRLRPVLNGLIAARADGSAIRLTSPQE